MADTSGMQDIRGINIDKIAKGFANEATIFKKLLVDSKTSARQITYWQKTSGFLTATSPAVIANAAEGALPFVKEQSWTKSNAYVRKYFVQSPTISEEDIRDSDVDILVTNVGDLTRAVEYAVDGRCWDVITESRVPVNINLVTCSGQWNTDANAYIIHDLMNAKQKIRAAGYNPEGAALVINGSGAKNLLTWLISTKGSSIPSFASQKVESGVVMELLGLGVRVSENVTNNYGVVMVPQEAGTWKSFTELTAAKVEEVGIGRSEEH